jgi:hypothetical protein
VWARMKAVKEAQPHHAMADLLLDIQAVKLARFSNNLMPSA